MNDATPPLEPLTVSVKEARRLTGLGTTSLYKAMGDGRLVKVKVGKTTLITYPSIKKLVAPPTLEVQP